MKKKVLVVDDTIYMRALIKDALPDDYEVVGEAPNGEIAIDMAFKLQPDLITLDNVLPDMMGLDVLKTLGKSDLNCKVLMVSAVGQQSMIKKGFELGASGYVVKPFSPEILSTEVNRLFNGTQLAKGA